MLLSLLTSLYTKKNNLISKGLNHGQVQPSGDLVVVLPIQNFTTTCLASPENLIVFVVVVQKFF